MRNVLLGATILAFSVRPATAQGRQELEDAAKPLIAVLDVKFGGGLDQCLGEQQKGFPEGYQLRTDYCDGLYRAKVSGTPLSLVGFSQPLGALHWQDARVLDLQWNGPPDKPVRLQALSMRQSVPYRMDATRTPSTTGRFSWPTEVVSRVGLESSEVALAAWYEAGDSSRVYLPIAIGHSSSARILEVTLYPGTDLKDCGVSLRSDGNGTNLLENRQPITKRVPAGTPIRFLLPSDLKPGLYKFEAFAHMETGGLATVMASLQMP
jgi:hypothetical protein